MKKCSKCLVEKEDSEFYSNQTMTYCKTCHKEKCHLWYIKHQDKIALKRKEYRAKEDKIAHRIYMLNYHRKRSSEINWRLKRSLRFRLWFVLKLGYKSKPTMKLVGCSLEFLKSHLESQFQPGMSWSNYGKWHIDHKRPCASFDLSKKEEQAKCFHYTNLQPLWAIDNLRKSAKII
jgi:hypothetical protein